MTRKRISQLQEIYQEFLKDGFSQSFTVFLQKNYLNEKEQFAIWGDFVDYHYGEFIDKNIDYLEKVDKSMLSHKQKTEEIHQKFFKEYLDPLILKKDGSQNVCKDCESHAMRIN